MANMALRRAKSLPLFQNFRIFGVNSTRLASSSGSGNADIVTHTGQQWDEKDYRMVRFVDKKKHVNPNWAAKLIAEVPPTATKSRVVWCDGGDAQTGHPRVYINLDKPGDHSCNYCGLRFEKEADH